MNQKQNTKPVQVLASKDARVFIKAEAAKRGMTMPDMLDHIVAVYNASQLRQQNARQKGV